MTFSGWLGRRRAGWWSTASVVAAVTVAGGLAEVPSVPAGAAVTATKWSVQPTPNAMVANGRLRGDSCTSPGHCVAVGLYESSSGTSALAEAWNGTAWRVQAVPVPPGGTHSALDGVSCSAVTACTAVGFYTTSKGVQVTLAERWNGTSWSVQPTPNAATAHYSVLNSVSCGSATSCMAVGYYRFGSTGQAWLLEQWNGSAWSVKQSASPPNAVYSFLYGVSCAGPAACVAVGNYLDSSSDDTLTLAEVWNGSTWRITATPNPAGSIVNYLLGVSCRSATACTAVGDWIAGAARKSAKRSGPLAATLAEAWNGTTWVIEATPNPAGSVGIDSLASVSCRSPASCRAVGSYSGATGGIKTLNEVWNGTAWAIQPAPNPGRDESALAGVSCVASAACTAVGYYRNRAGTFLALALASSGTAWTVQATPSPVGAVPDVLDSVSCAAATACAAVGFLENSQVNSMPLAESWNGTAWTVRRVPRPAGFGHSSLASVSCGSASSCMAVGKSYNKHSGATLAESWNGTAWAIVPTPAPPGAGGELTGVSCTAATACTAVGWYRDSSNNALPLAESWDGIAWTIQPVPSPTPGYGIVLNSVSCTSPSACTAVGTYTSSGAVALAERWNGTAWTIQATPPGDHILFGVSCGTSATCTAVGELYTFEHVGTLAEEWRHGTWHLEKTPPISTFFSELDAVACRSATACAAVGGYDDVSKSDVAATLAEAWNGSTWSIQPTPAPRGGTSSFFAGVSPTSATSFTAVGSHLSSAGVSVTLAERGPG